ncbi:hypothetical protein SRHO_G00115060 [Serrasalmus rhombeus]
MNALTRPIPLHPPGVEERPPVQAAERSSRAPLRRAETPAAAAAAAPAAAAVRPPPPPLSPAAMHSLISPVTKAVLVALFIFAILLILYVILWYICRDVDCDHGI